MYLSLNAEWNLKEVGDADQQEFEFALDTYNPELSVSLKMSRGAWEKIGMPTTIKLTR